VEEYADAVTSTLREELVRHGLSPDGVTLEVEPGRAVYADAGIHLATVVNVKSEPDRVPPRWVETDTTEMFLPDLLIEHNCWIIVVADRADAAPADAVDVVGKSCGFDVLGTKVAMAPVEPGSVLAFLDTGAYQDAASSNFNALPRPATVLVCDDTATVVKRAETVDDVLGRDVVPARLEEGA
jgi:diaminopimelate decarboxylase